MLPAGRELIPSIRCSLEGRERRGGGDRSVQRLGAWLLQGQTYIGGGEGERVGGVREEREGVRGKVRVQEGNSL